MRKPKPKSKKKKAWDMFSLYIRLRDCLKTTKTKDYGLCITCGKRFHFKELQAGHFIAGRNNSVLFSEEMVNAQCRSCNLFHHGRSLDYRRVLISLYGEEAVDNMEIFAKVSRKWKFGELDAIYLYYKQEYERLLGN